MPVRHLSTERLESRWVLYGGVSVAVVAGDLVVTGDVEANKIALWHDANSGDWMVGGGKIHHPFLVPNSETLINGQLAPQSFSGVTGDLLIDLGQGDDDLEISNAAFAGELHVNLGDGTNGVSLVTAFTFHDWIFNDDSAFVRGNLSLAGDISVTGGSSIDHLVIGPDVVINANLSFVGNDGNDYFNNSGVGVLAITGNVLFELGSGDDALNYQFPIQIDGNLTVTDVGSSSQLASRIDFVDLEVTGDISVTGGNGETTVRFERILADSVTISLGDGADAVNFVDSTIDVLDIDLGAGDDRETNVFVVTALTSIEIDSGSGEDVLDMRVINAPTLNVVTGDDSDAVIFLNSTVGAASIDTGAGQDVIGVYTITATTLAVLTGDGNEGGGVRFGLVVGTCNISGTLTVNSGAGLDNILLGSVTAANVVVLSGANSDGVIILFSNLGSLSVDSGDELDVVGCHDSVFDDLDVLLGSGFDQLWLGNLTVNNSTDLDGETGGGELYQSGTNTLSGLTSNLTPHV